MSEKPQDDLLESIISSSMPPETKAPMEPSQGGSAGEEAPPPPASGKGKKSARAGKSTSVYRYLLVLFGAAFILLLMAYFIQQRNSESAYSDLRDTMNLSRAELMEEIDGLKEEKAALEEQMAALSPLTDELAELQEEYGKLERELQSSESLYEEFKQRHDILTAFAILEQALRDKNYETAVKYVRILAQDNPDLGIMNLDGTAYFDNKARLAEIITLLERRGTLEPGEISIPGEGDPKQEG